MRRLAAVSAAVLVLSACDGDGSAATTAPEPTAVDVSSLRVTGQQEQVPAYWARLSPDGRTLLYLNENGTCVRGVDGSAEHCLEGGGPFEIDTAAWSPDGGRVAIAEELGVEPDIWVLDAGSGDLTNLTDDGVSAEVGLTGDFEVPPDAVFDGHPSWSADGERIRFLRGENSAVAVMAVPSGGGEPAKLGSIDTTWFELRTVAWTEDVLAWFSAPLEGVGDEVMVHDLAEGMSRTVLDGGEYTLLSFSADGEFLLADETSLYEPAVGRARVVPTRGGDPVPVATGDVRFPTWAPEGHAIAYVDSPGTLRVVGKPGGAPHDLLQESELLAADGGRLDWSPGAILVSIGENPPTVLRIDG
jgi:Tol biopolymer transport system component